MPVVMDRPRLLASGRWTAHLLSDRLGDAGSVELVAIAVTIGCHPYALQCAGTYKEHFDLMGDRRIRAAVGHPLVVQVGWRQIALILRDKKALPLGGVAPV